jgi:hypothetical protein
LRLVEGRWSKGNVLNAAFQVWLGSLKAERKNDRQKDIKEARKESKQARLLRTWS